MVVSSFFKVYPVDSEFEKFPLSKICPCGKILNFDADPEKVWIRAKFPLFSEFECQWHLAP